MTEATKYAHSTHGICWGFPGGSGVKDPPDIQETWVQSMGWEDPVEKEMATTIFLAGKFHG